MTVIPQRDLRNHNAKIIERVIGGESFVVTRDGIPVADVIPHVVRAGPPRFVPAADLPTWAPLPATSVVQWDQDLHDDGLDHSLRDPWDLEHEDG